MRAPVPEPYRSFREFYPDYLQEHRDPRSRRLHFIGTALVLATAAGALGTGRWWWLAAVPVFGYGFAWVGHFVFERNRPATFRHPLYSLAGDFKMFVDLLTGRLKL
jgi:hypothetical protein